MTEPERPVGWLVLDPDGNVVDFGPPIELEMVTQMGEPEQEVTDGSD
jgi:hypothetical protein